jgi:hypothetical protein
VVVHLTDLKVWQPDNEPCTRLALSYALQLAAAVISKDVDVIMASRPGEMAPKFIGEQ